MDLRQPTMNLQPPGILLKLPPFSDSLNIVMLKPDVRLMPQISQSGVHDLFVAVADILNNDVVASRYCSNLFYDVAFHTLQKRGCPVLDWSPEQRLKIVAGLYKFSQMDEVVDLREAILLLLTALDYQIVGVLPIRLTSEIIRRLYPAIFETDDEKNIENGMVWKRDKLLNYLQDGLVEFVVLEGLPSRQLFQIVKDVLRHGFRNWRDRKKVIIPNILHTPEDEERSINYEVLQDLITTQER